MSTKYELTDEAKNINGITLHRIRALRDIPSACVKTDDLGGWIEKESNLCQNGNAWVYGDARVYDNAWVSGNAWVYGDAEVSGNAKVSGNAEVYGDAEVKSSEDYCVFRNTWSSFRWFTYTHSNKKWAVGCFYGTGEELIKKAYADSELSGKCYEAIVRAQEAIDKAIEEAKETT